MSLASDGALLFEDNITEAAKFGVRHIAEPGGSTRSPLIAAAAHAHGISLTRVSGPNPVPRRGRTYATFGSPVPIRC